MVAGMSADHPNGSQIVAPSDVSALVTDGWHAPLKGEVMEAAPGSRIVVKGHRVGEPDRDCEVLEVHGADGQPPYVVRWADSGHEGLFFPGPDAKVVPYDKHPA
jgi:hypothetical protein